MSSAFADLTQLHFLRPLWLLGLVLLPLLAWWWKSGTRMYSRWRDVVDAHLLPQLLEGEDSARRRPWARWLGLLAATIAVVAMAGPSLRKQEHPLWQTRAPLVIALDLSSASLARDMPPSRLAQARAKIATLLRDRSGGQVALVAYAGDAYTVAPLTEDAANVALFLEALQPGIMPEDGQRTDRAIGWSMQLLRQAGFDRGDILVLTDHAETGAVTEAARARVAGYRVSALGLGSAQGGVFDTPGGLGQARLDAPSLQRLAASGGGGYQRLAPGNADLRALGVLDPRGAAAAAARGEKIASWRDDGYWLLPLVMLLALPLFRRGGVAAAMLVLVLCLPMPQANAQAQEPGSLWRRPDQQAHARMQEGIAAYRAKDYDKAAAGFARLGSADGQYNLGNALAKAGRYDEAIAAYDRALKLQPRMDDAIENRKTVDRERKKRKQEGQKPSQGEPKPCRPGDKNCYGKSDNADDPKRPLPDQSGDPSQSLGRQPETPQAKPQPGKAQDAHKQSAADAAQRQRIEDALRKQKKQAGESAPVRAKPAETAEQRERRIINQAQLQRVPDDPGGLLRARFRLEHERRQGRVP